MEKLKSILRRFKSLLTAWWYNVSSQPIEAKYGAFLFHLGAIIVASLILLGIYGCSTIKYVPIQTEERVEIRDSLIYVRDTIEIPIERQIIKEIIPSVDTSYLSTDLAHSTAYLDTLERKIHHTLEQSGTVKTVLDTCYITHIEEKIVYQDRPIEVTKEVKYIPPFFWWSLIFNIITVLFIIFKIYLKLKP